MKRYLVDCVLFDLDGTLVDTAPDLIASLNKALVTHGFAITDFASVKPWISHGAAAMIECAATDADTTMKSRLLETMLDHYQNHIAEFSRFYAGMAETLDAIESFGLKWGVVTNKRERFTLPLMNALQLNGRTACIVSGDTTGNSKPHPEPMYAACRQAGVEPEHCVYVGDAEHDITAGKNAKMKTLVAVYGYLQPGDRPERWGADALIEHPQQLLQWLDSTICH